MKKVHRDIILYVSSLSLLVAAALIHPWATIMAYLSLMVLIQSGNDIGKHLDGG